MLKVEKLQRVGFSQMHNLQTLEPFKVKLQTILKYINLPPIHPI